MTKLAQSLITLAAAFAFAIAAPVAAQDYPSKPIRLVVGFPPGGNVDLVARLVAIKMSENIKQQVVVDNRAGAGSAIANGLVAKAPADGYTLLLVSGAFVTLPAVTKKLAYDSVKDFDWVSTIVTYPIVITVGAGSRFKSLEDVLGYAKANPGKLNYPSPGVGTFFHLAGEYLQSLAGVEMTHVPFRGGGEPITETIAGRMDVMFDAAPSTFPHVQAGKLRPLAVSSTVTSAAYPNVPLVSRTVPGFEAVSFSGIAAPAGTPPAIIERLNREVARAIEAPEVRGRLADGGGEPRAGTPVEMGRMVEAEIAKWKRVVEVRKIEVQ
ncbi:MAG: tripartite tricarboxylate transporter substrate binding protein [Burkholderiales bacterium]